MRLRNWASFAILLAAVLAAYQPAWHGGLLWDDGGHITRLDLQPISGLWRIWFEVGATQQYYPLTHSTFWVAHRLWADDTFGYHILNIVLHAGTATLLTLVLRRLAIPGAFLAGALFALHPIEVESVAWISELKNTESGFLYFSAFLAYLEFDQRRSWKYYAVAILLFIGALLSKSVTATLPVAIAIAIWWRNGLLSVRKDLLPLAPMILLAAVGGTVTAWVESHFIGATGQASFDLSWADRLVVAGRAAWFYVWKILWPANLAFVYPRWVISAGDLRQWVPTAAAAAVVLTFWIIRRRSRAPLAAALFFLVTLSPALGFVNVWPFKFSFVADHFQYLAGVGLIVPAAALFARLSRHWLKEWRIGAGIALCLVPAVLTSAQSADYRDIETLYRQTIRRNPQATMARSNLAAMLLDRGSSESLKEAEEQTRLALQTDPANTEARLDHAIALERLDRPSEALVEYQRAIESAPPGEMNNRRWRVAFHGAGRALRSLGRREEAVAAFRQARTHDPTNAEVATDLGVALAETGHLNEARQYLEEACRIGPSAASYNNLGAFLLQHENAAQAISVLSKAIGLDSSIPEIHFNLVTARHQVGRALYLKGDIRGALEQLAAAAADSSATASVHNDLGLTFWRLGDRSGAQREFETALRLDPTMEEARTNLFDLRRGR